MEFKEPFMVLKISTGFGALWTSYGTAVLFDSCRMEFKEPFMVLKISTGFGALWTSYGTAVLSDFKPMVLLFDSCRMEFKEPFMVSKYPLASGLFGLHMEQADAPAVLILLFEVQAGCITNRKCIVCLAGLNSKLVCRIATFAPLLRWGELRWLCLMHRIFCSFKGKKVRNIKAYRPALQSRKPM